ncbi:hypothetical protein CLV59_106103 [Chitinophaga dinghuensis]|uniref:Uncharacterized protein n=1 Tax=Chitinophaga dinghuensis TaxID=1539050 RepID=A0A327VUU0_9BACT|nr:hypothetical protein [Chitinophaga dinghuensis]RAJ79043.1 hypothetical protein CLV59_106103 [Chitinophaga dinghuensis]
MTTNQTVNKDWKPFPQNPNQPHVPDESGDSLWDAVLAQPDILDEEEEEEMETPAPKETKTGVSEQ